MLSRIAESPVLDRPLHRAQRRHRAHPRRAPAAAARGPVDRRGHSPAARSCSVMGTEAARGRRASRRERRARASSPSTATKPASIAYSLTAARENARRAREIVSTELWEALNTTSARMPRKVAERQGARVLRLGARALRARRRHRRLRRRAATRRGSSSRSAAASSAPT